MFKKEEIIRLKEGALAVIPTDTLYGLVTTTRNKTSYEKLVRVKGIKPERVGFIVLIPEIESLKEFGIKLGEFEEKICKKAWPGPFSIEFKIRSDFKEMTGFDVPAFRVPNNEDLLALLKETGPLFAPSANITNMPPSKTISEAKKYFGDQVDFYIDAGILDNPPSTVIAFDGEKIIIKRQGSGDMQSLGI